jgi:hypothetical protein
VARIFDRRRLEAGNVRPLMLGAPARACALRRARPRLSRQTSGEKQPDVIVITAGQAYDLIDALCRAVEEAISSNRVCPMNPILIFIMWVSLTSGVVSAMLNYKEPNG